MRIKDGETNEGKTTQTTKKVNVMKLWNQY